MLVEFDALDEMYVDEIDEFIADLERQGATVDVVASGRPLGAIPLLEVVEAITVTGASFSVVVSVLVHARNTLKRGVLVDLRGDPVLSPDRALPTGSVLIVGPDGSVTFDRSTPVTDVAEAVLGRTGGEGS